jgi:hypothetical protein
LPLSFATATDVPVEAASSGARRSASFDPVRSKQPSAAARDRSEEEAPVPSQLSRLALLGLLGLVSATPAESQALTGGGGIRHSGIAEAATPEVFGKLPLYFVENRGEVDARVAYYVQGRDTTVYFTSDGITVALTGPASASAVSDAQRRISRSVSLVPTDAQRVRQRWAVKLDFVGARPEVRPRGEDRTPAVISYFKGPREHWRTGLETYASLAYSDLWPGIDLVFNGTATRLKYMFVIHPGADPGRIKLAYRGATAVTLTKAGELEVSTPVGGFRDERPYAYQEVEGRRVEVATAYQLGRGAHGSAQDYSFILGSYDRTRPLILDPAMLVYAGYIGGEGTDVGAGIAVDAAGNAYVSGFTDSSEATFPVTVGPDVSFNGQVDAFVAKVDAAGTGLVYAGYIGGTGDDIGQGIALDGAGDAYVTGYTDSSEASFPVILGPDVSFNGGVDVFVAKVNAVGTGLVYAGYIGGAGRDVGFGMAVDLSGNAYVGGTTQSSQATFPVMLGPDLTHNGGDDGFVAKVNPLGTGLVYAGYVGGSGGDGVAGIAVDVSGSAYIVGPTFSTQATFPVTVGPDVTFNGVIDAFVAKVKAVPADPIPANNFHYCGYIGGSNDDRGTGVAHDGGGNAYVTGHTTSTQATFPDAVGPDLTFNGVQDAFVAKVNAAGTGLLYAGYIGGSGFEAPQGIAVDVGGNAYVTGQTGSSDGTFPATGGPDLTHNGSIDAFVAKVNAAGTGFVYAGFVGGSGDDYGFAIAVDGAGNAYATGQTSSSEATFPVTVGPDLTYNGGPFDAFVVKIGDVGTPATLTLYPPAATNAVDTQHCVTATVEDADGDPVPDVTVRFTVTGSVNTGGSATTDENGQAMFCYMGPPLPGDDLITAYADTDDDNTQDVGEPTGVATKAWVLPTTTPLCDITISDGGRITALNGDRATFGGNARSSAEGDTQGQQEYHDHGPVQRMNVNSINVLAIVCEGTTAATIYGQAIIDGSGSYYYRIRVQDLAEPGKDMDTYWILLQNGYNSGEQKLEGGNVQVRRE